jgi:hypothetical protein
VALFHADSGRAVAELALDDKGPNLRLNDAKGYPRLALTFQDADEVCARGASKGVR